MRRTSHSPNALKSKHPRWVELAVVGVLVPATLLALLALRSLSQEREIATDRTRRRLGAAARLAAQEVESAVQRIVADQVEVAATMPLLESQERDAALATIATEHAMVIGSIAIDAEGHIDIANVPRPRIDVLPRPATSEIERVANQLQWVRMQPAPDRLGRYQAIARDVRDKTLRGEVWCEVARECERHGARDQALDWWARVTGECAGAVGLEGFPLAALANVRSAQLLLDGGELEAAADAIAQAAPALCFNPWHAEPVLVSFLVAECQRLIDRCEQQASAADVDQSLASARTALALASSMPALEGVLMPELRPAIERGNAARAATEIAGVPLIAIATPVKNVAGVSALVVLIDGRDLVHDVLHARLTELAEAHDARLVINDRSGTVLLGSAAVAASEPIEETLPLLRESSLLTIRSVPRDQNVWSREKRQTSILQATVLIALLALVFGGAIAVRSASRELELATLQADFVGCVSHELKTPITAIRLLGEMLESGNVKHEKLVPYGEVIARESQRLQALIDNVLMFRQLEAGGRRFDLVECDLRESLHTAMRTLKPEIERLGFTVSEHAGDQALPVRGDRDALSQVFINLVGNAIKYSAERKEIELAASIVNGSVVVSVRDFGIGIPHAEQVRIFEKFYRASNGRAGKGTGLGLTIAREIVTAHGGEIQVRSVPGEGSEFRLCLPRCGGDERHG